MSSSGGDGGLAKLNYDGTAGGNYTEAQKPQDAIAVISGVEIHSANNVLDKAIDGVTLSVKSAKPGTVVGLSVSNDQATVIANVQKLVTAYNTMQGQLHALGSYDAAAKKGGPLLGDFLLDSAEFQLTRGMTDQVVGVGGGSSSLAAVGITTNADGSMSVDSTKLQAALTSDSGSVARMFSGANGVATRLGTVLSNMLSSGGAIAARDTNLTTSQKDIIDQTARLDAQMVLVQQRYLAQFNALDALMSQLQSTSNYLTQQLTNTAKIGNGNTG